MNFNMNELIEMTFLYCRLSIQLNECKWYEFARKRIIKEEMNWTYPLMRAEMNLITPNQ